MKGVMIVRRVPVPVSPESPCQGPKKEGSIASVVGAMQGYGAVAIHGARLVPRRPLQPFRAGFDSPALHFHLR